MAVASKEIERKQATSRVTQFRAALGAWGFMSPAILLVVVFFFIPVIILFYLSMTDLASHNISANVLEWNFTGIENYRRMFSDKFFP